MGCLLVLLVLRQIIKRMVQGVRCPGLLCEQHDEGKKQRKEYCAG